MLAEADELDGDSRTMLNGDLETSGASTTGTVSHGYFIFVVIDIQAE